MIEGYEIILQERLELIIDTIELSMAQENKEIASIHTKVCLGKAVEQVYKCLETMNKPTPFYRHEEMRYLTEEQMDANQCRRLVLIWALKIKETGSLYD